MGRKGNAMTPTLDDLLFEINPGLDPAVFDLAPDRFKEQMELGWAFYVSHLSRNLKEVTI